MSGRQRFAAYLGLNGLLLLGAVGSALRSTRDDQDSIGARSPAVNTSQP